MTPEACLQLASLTPCGAATARCIFVDMTRSCRESNSMRRFALAILASLAILAAPAASAEDQIVVFAAASLKTALDAVATKYQADGGAKVVASYGGSLSLARQIVAGAPADIFMSADEPSMDEAAKGNAIRSETRIDLLSNRLVLIAPKATPLASVALEREALAKAIGDSRLATGDVGTVPVGKYAKASLTKLGLWEVVESHLAMTPDVRTALAFVARGEAGLGIVYATDAAAEPNVKIVAAFPDDSHPPILYPVAITAASKNPEAAKFFDFLKGAEAHAIFAAQGFGAAK
jgi:molybdate transport system substrate-binding protein